MDEKIREQKVAALLGFAQKAGKLVSGDDMIAAAAKKGKILLYVVAYDIGENTKKEFIHMVKKTSVPWGIWGDKAHLGYVIGKAPRALVGVTEENFAKALQLWLEGWNQGIKEEWLNG